MNISIIKIGNSKGVRIPKPLLEESELSENVQITAKKGEIRITPAEPKQTNKNIKLNEEYLLSLSALSDWDRPEEDEAWAYLQ